MINKVLLTAGLLMFGAVSAQKTHTVAKGDNPYNIAKKYGISLDELVKLNPKAKDGKLNIGDVLVINNKAKAAPKTAPQKTTEVQPASANFSGKTGTITLVPKQTIYGITKQYHVTENLLRQLNPNLDSNMKIGNKIVLPLENIRKYGTESSEESVVVQASETAQEAANAGDFYTVQPKDNYYRIARNHNITQKQLLDLNPGLEAKGLQPGDVIRISGNIERTVSEPQTQTASTPVADVKTSVSDDYVTYTVQSGDTVFGILNKFGITLDQLLELNPELSGGLKSGMVLKIRKIDEQYVKKSGDALNVVMMLPFGFDTNDSKYRAMSTDFLTGAKLAIERNVGQGQKLDIKVVDAGNEASFKNSLSQINKNNTDLIIGPFFKSSVLEVLNYVGNSKIPVVAPFANSSDLHDFSNLIIVETADNVYAERIAKEVKDVYSNQKIYIVEDADGANANLIRSSLEKSLKSPNIIMVKSAQDIQPDTNMMTGQSAPVIAILASTNDTRGNDFSNRVIALSKEVAGVKAFSMFYHPSFEKKVDDLSQANLVYLMDRKINTDGSFEKEILADFKEKYCKTPSKYAVIGFDVVNDILSRENKKGEVFKQIGKVQTQLATKFEYVKAKNNGAYVNTGYRVVRLVP